MDAEATNREIADEGRAAKARAAREQMLLVRDAAKPGRAGDDARGTLSKADADRNALRVSINAPHKASTHGNHLSLNIAPQQSTAGQTAAASSDPKPFELYDASTTTGGTTTLKVGVRAGGINAGAVGEFTFTVSGSGVVYAKVEDDSDYFETDWTVEHGADTPDSTEHTGYCQIGTYAVTSGKLTVANDRYGPVNHINTTGTEHQWG